MKFPAVASMSPKELAGQLLMPAINVRFLNRAHPEFRQILQLVTKFRVGGIILFGGHPGDVQATLRYLQDSARIFLLTAADMERGTGGLFSEGTVFPHALAWGAAADTNLARQAAKIIAGEARSIGINTLFAPVLDLVCEPANPIVNIRGFHQKPSRVAEYGHAFISAVQSCGIACVAKHFPGHGRTHQDSHLQLPEIKQDLPFLLKRDMLPFQRAIAAGVKGIMSAHILARGQTLPATLNPEILQKKLREKFGFAGVIFSDALNMKAISERFTLAEQITLGMQAGVNIFLMPEKLPLFHRLLSERIENDDSMRNLAEQGVERVLQLKKWIHQLNPQPSHPGRLYKSLSHPNHHGKAMELAEKALTCIHHSRRFPLPAESVERCRHLIYTDFPDSPPPLHALNQKLQEFFQKTDTRLNLPPSRVKKLGFADSDLVIISLYRRTFGGQISRWDWKKISAVITGIENRQARLILLVFGNPFGLENLKNLRKADAVFLLYSYVEASQLAAFKAVISAVEAGGKLPVIIGQRRHRFTSRRIFPKTYQLEDSPRPSVLLPEVDQLIQQSILENIFPGGVLLAAHQGRIIFEKAYGNFDYEPGSSPVHQTTLYDLASLTKVLSTTPAILLLSDRHQLRLDQPVSFFYGQDLNPAYRLKTIADLLAHQAGFPAWQPFYETASGKDDLIRQILQTKPAYPSRQKSVYSDLGFMLLGDIIERISGNTLDQFFRERLLKPLGLQSLHFIQVVPDRPSKNLKSSRNYPPTGRDAFRQRIIQGEVNDANCYAMGGVAGHAGLFGTARDVAAIGQLFLNRGIYNCQRIIQSGTAHRAIIKHRRAGADRALGWDLARRNSGNYFSSDAFGHLAFTGPSIWADPRTGLIVVFLCNRTHPDPQHNLMHVFRPQLHAAITRVLRRQKLLKKS